MSSVLEKSPVLKLAAAFGGLIGLVIIAGTSSLASTSTFAVPEDTALRIRLDDTLTSVDSEVGDSFSATVVDTGKYRNARVYVTSRRLMCRGRSKAILA